MATLIHAGTLLTAVDGQDAIHNQGVLIEDGIIRAVDRWDAFSPGDDVEVIDASRQTVLPGLIDAHIHITATGEPRDQTQFLGLTELAATSAFKAARHALRHLEMGVTTVRVLGTMDWVDIALRDGINAGWFPGPRIVAAGPGITSTGGHADRRKALRGDIPQEIARSSSVIDSADDARRVAWEILMRGADVIKIMATLSEYVRARGGQCSPELTFDAMKAICEVAHGAGRKVAAHCHGGPGVDAAIEAGVDTFEHGRFLTDDQLERMAALDRFLVPTLSPEARTDRCRRHVRQLRRSSLVHDGDRGNVRHSRSRAPARRQGRGRHRCRDASRPPRRPGLRDGPHGEGGYVQPGRHRRRDPCRR